MFILSNESKRPWNRFVNIHTIQVAKWRLLKDTPISFIDTTVKTAPPQYSKLFAPPGWDVVMGVKNGTISEQEYERLYIEKLNYTYNTYTQEWLDVLNQGDIAIACYCKYGKFCHRHILARFIQRVAFIHGYDAFLRGELFSE